MPSRTKGVREDNYQVALLNDFSGGWNTVKGALSLSLNETNDLLNLITFPGRLQYRGGWQRFAGLPGPSDGAWPFYDANGAKHIAVWAGGNLYDCISGIAVLIENAVYTAGQRVGHADNNGILYWTTTSVPIRFWNVVAGTHGPVVTTGPNNTPSGSFLFFYQAILFVLQPDFIGPVYGQNTQKNVMSWAAVNDPTNWNAINSQAVGQNNGGALEFAMPFGFAESGISPLEQIIVGRNDFGIYAYSGSVPTLHETLTNCPVGVRDRESVQYLPSDGDFGTILFLGTDNQVYETNGIEAKPISLQVLPTLQQSIGLALANNANQRFFSGYNKRYAYYWLDVAGQQFGYKWDVGCWFPMIGWPSGFSIQSTDATGVPAVFIASSDQSNVLAQVAMDAIPDNGTMPSVYYNSPPLHAGNPALLKEFEEVFPFFYDNGAQYTVTGQTIKRQDGSQLVSSPMVFKTPSGVPSGKNPFILGKSLLGGPDVLATSVATPGTGTVVENNGRFSCPVDPDLYGVAGLTEKLAGGAVQVKFAWSGGTTDFEMVAAEVVYVSKGYRRVGNQGFNPEGGESTAFDPNVAPQ